MYDPIWSILLVEGDYKAVIIGRESGTVEKYRLNDLKGKPVLSIRTAHKGTVTTLALTPAGAEEFYSASLDKSICQWNFTDDLEALEGGKRLLKTTLTTTGIRCGVVSGEAFCCGGSDGNIHVLREGGPERWVGHSDIVSCVASCTTESGEPLLASGSYDGRIRIWNVNSGISLFVLEGHTSQIKGVQFINGHLGVMGVGRDDAMRLWQLPEELETEENANAPPAHDEGEDGEVEGDEDSSAHTRGYGPKKIECSAVLGLPSSPLCAVSQPESESPLIAVGLSGGDMAIVKANKFLSTVSNYTKINGSEAKKERKRLEALLKAEEKKESQLRKKAIRNKKKELTKDQQTEETDKKNAGRAERNAAKQLKRAAEKEEADDEEEEEQEAPEEEEPEDEDEEEEGEGVTLTDERQAALEEFKEQTKKDSDERIKSLRTSVAERKQLLEPIATKKFEREAKQFEDLSFTRYHPKAASETIQCIALNGATAIVAAGGRLALVDGTPGVRSL